MLDNTVYEGKRIGLLTVLKRDDSRESTKNKYWFCKCDCGKMISTRASELKTARSCGCIRSGSLDYVGKRFGRLIVVKPNIEMTTQRKRGIYLDCICDCGNMHTTLLSSLNSKQVRSCGCLLKEVNSKRQTTHGKTNTRLYRIWHTMKSRCLNESAANYHKYGGKGIRICEEWINSFESFYKWSMENGYHKGLTVDRENNDEGYNPENCRWVTYLVQENNKSSCIPVVVHNKYFSSLNECGRYYNIPSVMLGKHKNDLQEYINKRLISKRHWGG